jgi:uncharacterized Zn finger protein
MKNTTTDLLAQMDGFVRWEKAKEMIKTLQIRKIPRTTKWQLWKVPSQTDPKKIYSVVQKETNEYECDCPDYALRGNVCKHIFATLLLEVTR